MTSAANADLGVGGSLAPHGDDTMTAGQLGESELRNAQKLDELAAAIAALSEQLDKAAGPSARRIAYGWVTPAYEQASDDRRAQAVHDLEHRVH